MLETHQHAARLVGGIVLMAGANVASQAATAQNGDNRITAIVGWVTLAITSICGAVVLVAPLVANAIRHLATTIVPALGEIWKQREEIRKGTYTAQIADLTAKIGDLTEHLLKAEEDRKATADALVEANRRLQEATDLGNSRVEDINQKLHEAKKEVNRAALKHAEEMDQVMDKLETVTSELTQARLELQSARLLIADLREHDSRLLTGMAIEQEQHRASINENRAAIQELQGSKPEMPVVRGEGGVTG